MAEENYSKRELDDHFKDMKDTLTRIERQTTMTNGRVLKLEGWRWFITGGMSILSMLIVPIIIAVMVQYLGA